MNDAVVVLASGPSLTLEDIELVERSKIKTIAVNTTWKKARFCDILYAGDLAWWKHNHESIDISAQRWSCSSTARHKYQTHYRGSRIKPGHNSGANAIELAYHLGARKILLLGFDCSVINGTHHHGDHSKTANPNEKRCKGWERQFQMLTSLCKDATIINCSRFTALDCFPKKDIKTALSELQVTAC